LKKAAKVAAEKSIEMIKSKELLPLTGYIHGGCSPIGIKKKHTIFIHKSALDNKTILVSGGLRGLQIEIEPQKLIDYLKMVVGDIIEDIEVKNIAIFD